MRRDNCGWVLCAIVPPTGYPSDYGNSGHPDSQTMFDFVKNSELILIRCRASKTLLRRELYFSTNRVRTYMYVNERVWGNVF